MTGDRLLMAERSPHKEAPPESEPVVVEQVGETVVLHLDDGDDLRFDRRELRAALDEAA